MVDVGLIKFTSSQGRSEFKGGGGVSLSISALFHVWQQLSRILVLLVAKGGMAGKNPLSREGNHGVCLPRRLGGDRGDGSFRFDEAEVRMNG